MKLPCVALILPYYISGQVYDNFSDGDFTNNPNWFGLPTHFEIDSEYRLHLDAPSENASSHLCLSSDIIENASWEINVKLTFNPSGSNYLDWYLTANDSIREICHSELITHKANWIWDGLHESYYELPMGIYMVVAELIDARGNQNIVKHPAVLSKQ